MIWIVFVIYFVLIYGYNCNEAADFRQEAAKVVYANPKYVKDVSVITIRHKRNSPYLTSVNCTTLHTWNNNITLLMVYEKFRSDNYQLAVKGCDFLKFSWGRQWLKDFTDIPLQCPFPPNTYHLMGIELPPKDFPMPTFGGDFTVKSVFTKTESKEKIMEFKVKLRFEGKKKKTARH